MTPNTTTLFSMVAWCIWTRRNKLRERQPVRDVGETVKRARELLQELKDVQDSPILSAIPWVESENSFAKLSGYGGSSGSKASSDFCPRDQYFQRRSGR
uniref:Uncharacterized protein n=1 Tax=Quercus lobata TaxID=97700 RepID=A0A7N2MKX4_QUELO